MSTKNLYDHFGCKKGECLNEVKKRAHETILRVHPDKRQGLSKEATEAYNKIFACANETRKILCNRLRRSVYNHLLRIRALPDHGGVDTNFDKINDAIDIYIKMMSEDERRFRMGHARSQK
jgi:DnaJ-class molecular chaperone